MKLSSVVWLYSNSVQSCPTAHCLDCCHTAQSLTTLQQLYTSLCKLVLNAFLPHSYDIMFQSWDADPTNRPSFSYHHQQFESFLSSPSTPATLVAMEIDEQKSYYYHKTNRHEPLHRLAASPSHNVTTVTVATVSNSSNAYVDHALPKIVEEREVSECGASDTSESTSTAKGVSEETASTDEGVSDMTIESPV